MSNKKLAILGVAAIVMVVLAGVQLRLSTTHSSVSVSGPSYLIQGLDTNKIASIVLGTADDQVILTRSGNRFVVSKQANPPIPWPEDYSTSEWSVYSMNPYIDCVDKDYENNGIGSEVLACPNAGGDFFVELLYIFWEEMCQGSINTYWIFSSYSYWGGLADAIAKSEYDSTYSANALRELTLDTMSPKRLLMSENLYLDSGIWWNYNHGKRGWSCAFGWLAPQYQIKEKIDGEQDATGTSQLFGDGRVQWRQIPLKFEDNLPSQRLDLGDVAGFREDEWNDPGSGFIESNGVDYAYY